MRQGSNPKRIRGRSTGRKHSHSRSQTFESNGPEVKVRGNAQQVVEKYLALARDATSAGDRITAESYFQHAEHYYRVMTANGGYDDRNGQGRANGEYDGRADAAQPAVRSVETPTNGAAGHEESPQAQENGASASVQSDVAPPEPQPQD